MANDKTNINELVTDDEDTTAELEALTTKHFRTSEDEVLLEQFFHRYRVSLGGSVYEVSLVHFRCPSARCSDPSIRTPWCR